MRHIRTLIAGLVVAPVAYVLLAAGEVRPDGGLARPLMLVVAGLLLGVLGTLRVSPLGAVAVAVPYTLGYVLSLLAPARVFQALPPDFYVAEHRLDLAAPLRTGLAGVVGVLLLVAAASWQRWRPWPRPGAAAVAGEPSTAETRRDEERPLGADGLGLTQSYRDDYREEPTTREQTLTDSARWR
ncbi:hypothetical protein AB0M46_39755 [Dactylosporangium sp. NPDC051485]|uniref:hypothetical protein n=1 Tax=Dactylosporangium sp. NPDC051485 TaxID=3154846 RepID=UPI0034304402